MIPSSLSVHAKNWHFMKTSWALWGAWDWWGGPLKPEPLRRVHTHSDTHTQYKEWHITSVILLLILYSSIITWKICAECVKRLWSVRRLFYANMLPTFSMAPIHSGERLPHCYLVKSVQSDLGKHLCTPSAGIVTPQSGCTVNRLDGERFSAFKAWLLCVSKTQHSRTFPVSSPVQTVCYL